MKSIDQSIVKTGTQKVKKILCLSSIALTMAGIAGAAVVYTEDFSAATLDTSSSSHSLGGGAPTAIAGDWLGPNNGADISGGTLNLTAQSGNRYRAGVVWLDTSSWSNPGLANLTVDISGYVAGTGTGVSFFQPITADGVDGSNSVDIDVHAGPGGPVLGGTATSVLGNRQFVTGNGTQTFSFSVKGEQFVGLLFGNESVNPDNTPVWSVDNISLDVIAAPEPSSLALVMMGGVVMIMSQRKRKSTNMI